MERTHSWKWLQDESGADGGSLTSQLKGGGRRGGEEEGRRGGGGEEEGRRKGGGERGEGYSKIHGAFLRWGEFHFVTA